MYYNPINPKRRKWARKILIFESGYSNGELDGLVKEYDDDGKLIFEGEYKNGMILNGKQYINNKIIFELKNGKGKEYYKYCNLIFEGEYLNGERNGKGKKYDHYGNIKFEGEYLNGEKVE